MPTILHTEASLGLGGQELRIVAESRWLRDHGWGALIACQPESRLFAEARTAGVDAVALPMRNAVALGALLALRRLMKALAVDLVHTHSSTDSWSGALAAKSLRLPVVRSRHVSIAIRSALVYRLADRIVTSGEAVRAIVVRAGIAPERVVAIPPGVDTARFHPAVSGKTVRDELRLGAGELLVGLVANIRGSKGHNVFLEAAREILRQAPLTRFLIGGARWGARARRRSAQGSRSTRPWRAPPRCTASCWPGGDDLLTIDDGASVPDAPQSGACRLSHAVRRLRSRSPTPRRRARCRGSGGSRRRS